MDYGDFHDRFIGFLNETKTKWKFLTFHPQFSWISERSFHGEYFAGSVFILNVIPCFWDLICCFFRLIIFDLFFYMYISNFFYFLPSRPYQSITGEDLRCCISHSRPLALSTTIHARNQGLLNLLSQHELTLCLSFKATFSIIEKRYGLMLFHTLVDVYGVSV